jgi:hypothetical protein
VELGARTASHADSSTLITYVIVPMVPKGSFGIDPHSVRVLGAPVDRVVSPPDIYRIVRPGASEIP